MSDSKMIQDPVPGKVCVVVGTRPGIIKMSPLISQLEQRDVDSFTLHTGQHYSYELDQQMFEDLGLEPPKHHLEDTKESTYHGEQTASMLEGIEQVLLEERPEYVLVCGDANFNLAGALAARKLRLTLGHVEAGLRSDDWRMPEEHNRVMIDHISDYLFAPTAEAKRNAVEDNVKGFVLVTGNTIVDAVERNLDIANDRSTIHDELGIAKGEYGVFTAHREENVDEEDVLKELIEVIERFTAETDLDLVYPIHPRTEKRLKQFGLNGRIEAIEGLQLVDPLGYLDFLSLLSSAEVALTDSGGIQEESCILRVPCVTLRENTERPETVAVESNVVAGTNPGEVMGAVEKMRSIDRNWENPFGDGDAAETITETVIANDAHTGASD